MSSGERYKVAQELAAKDGQAWGSLDEVMVNAYLHNADLVIAERNPQPVDESGKPVYSCDRCQDKAYIGGKRCLECNPMGLSVEKVHPRFLIIPEALPGKTMEETVEIARTLIKGSEEKAAAETEALAKKEADEKAELEAREEPQSVVQRGEDDNFSGTGRDNHPAGGRDTSQPKQPKKRKAKKKA